MKKIGLSLVIVCSVLAIHAQGTLSSGGPGTFYKPENSEVLGSPLLFPQFVPGIVYLLNGNKEENFLLNFDLYSNKLVYLEDGQQLVVVNAIKEFILKPTDGNPLLFRKGYQPVEKNTPATIYQVLEQGNYTLLKLTKKFIKDKKEFNQPPAKEFGELDSYFIVQGEGVPVKIKKDRSSVISALGDKEGKLEEWARKNNNRCKSEEELKSLVKAANNK